MDQRIIIMGDLNGVVNPTIDRSARKGNSAQGKLPKTFFALRDNLELVDTWRHKHPITKQFTHYSEPNRSSGRIDYVWTSQEIADRVNKVEILPRTLSDHNPIYLEIKGERVQTRWRMNESLFNDQEIVEKTRKSLKEYFELNLDKGTDINIVWDANYKLFTNILANRLKTVVNKVIHKDQTGFLPGRQMKENIRTIVDIIEYLEMKINKKAALIFIDAEKAFDNVSWIFMEKTLEKMEIRGNFLRGISAIYSEQKAKLIINNALSKTFNITKGTRQGCPLSPLMFIMVLEVLANKIRDTDTIKVTEIILVMNERINNESSVSEFLLLEFSAVRKLQILHFSLFLVLYLATVFVNLLIISAVTFDHHLHTPMYFFLINLAIQDLGAVSVTIPKSMANYLMNTRYISYTGCVAQVLSLVFFLSCDISLLTVMAYDRYVAICNPLQYEMVMNRAACKQMVAGVWVSGLVNAVLHTCGTFATPFCSNIVNQFFCEIPKILPFACTNLYLREIGALVVSVTVVSGCFVFIVVTYVHIFTAVLKIPSVQGRKKAFSTCIPHLVVFSIFCFTGCFAYFRPPSKTPSDLDFALTVMYSLVPPMCNPIIYSMRIKEIKNALSKLLGLWQSPLDISSEKV
ncbi:uncharacterized protein LOC117057724 [Lacerta agilis]|uniref:uncharacterized protein LOC117057724 n=1 Tax=Lacerta agilis TaxID=80427 RepID=UPI001419C93A|nr:uncharacterized protein LOC117057724 [Lacerta agilis]